MDDIAAVVLIDDPYVRIHRRVGMFSGKDMYEIQYRWSTGIMYHRDMTFFVTNLLNYVLCQIVTRG